MQLLFNKEEKFHVESIAAKRNNLSLQDQMLQKELDGVIVEFCKRNSVDVAKAKTLNIEQGFIEFEDEKTKKDKTTKNKR